MQYTKNNGLIIKDKTDNYSRERFNTNMNIIDNAIAPFYVATATSTANVYQVTTGLSKTTLEDGYSIKIAVPSSSTGAVSIIVDTVTVAVKKPNGNAVTNFKANGVYALTYYNGNFILASGGSDADATSVGIDGSNVKTGITFIGSDDEVHTGTFTADGTATASQILSGKIAYVKGQKITGNIPSLGATTYTPKTSNQTIASGKYLSGVQTIKGDANLIASNIIKGKSIFGVAGSATPKTIGGRFSNIQSFTLKNSSKTITTSFSIQQVLIYLGPSGSRYFYTGVYIRGIHTDDNRLRYGDGDAGTFTVTDNAVTVNYRSSMETTVYVYIFG